MVPVTAGPEPAPMAARLILERLRLARSLPPGVVMQRAAGLVLRRVRAAKARRRDIKQSSYCRETLPGPLNSICEAIPLPRLMAQRHWIEPLAAHYAAHRFNLLGSGWVQVCHGMSCKGVDDVLYPPGPAVKTDATGNWLAGRINPANLSPGAAIWQLIDADYQPIDWQIDFKSGSRWREDCWSADIPFGIENGVDVKMPWELARMQHLVILAFADAIDRAGTETVETGFQRAFRNQVLDFIATNPPRFGVNWRCTMDVGIRAANWAMAYGLFRANGATFDAAFETVLAQSLIDHGRHIITNLEFYPEGRSNHYLADIAGLGFIAAILPATNETDGWMAFALQEIQGEMRFQFNEDGSNFEGSTSYHCLSLEMATVATALFIGQQAERVAAALQSEHAGFSTRPTRPLHRPVQRPGPDHAERLARAAEFLLHVTKPNGRIVQIGDNDDGRFFLPHPQLKTDGTDKAPGTNDGLDRRGLIEAIAALANQEACTGDERLDADLVRALTRGAGLRLASGFDHDAAARVRVSASALLNEAKESDQTMQIVVPDGGLRHGLTQFGYPDFGLWIFRSDRIFLAVRCGPSVGEGSPGSHAHNDQLSIELAIDGEDWIADPGSYLYCPPIERRNAWRSVNAHAAPHWGDREPGRLDVGPFRMIDLAHARCLHFSEEGFAGSHTGFDTPVRRDVIIGDDIITVLDTGLPPDPARRLRRCVGREETHMHFRAGVPFSTGYGQLGGSGT